MLCAAATPAWRAQRERQENHAPHQSPRVGVRVPPGRRAAGTPNCGVAQRYSSVSASGGISRPAKFSRIPARLSSAAPNPAVARSQVTRNGRAADEIARHRHPAEDRPGQPERGERAQADRQVAIAVGRAQHRAQRQPAPDVRLAHGVGDREESAQRADDHQQPVHHDRERQQQDAGDAQDQAHDQHAEGGQDEDLSQQPGREGAAERMGHRIGHHFEVGPPEHHQPEAERREREEDADHAGQPPEDRLQRARRRLGGRGRLREDGGRAEGPDLAADLAAQVAHIAAQRQDVAGHQAARVHDHVAVHRDQVAEQSAVDVGVALHHQQRPGRRSRSSPR